MVQFELSFLSNSLRIGENEICYLDEGSGNPILLLHGAPMTSLGFGRVIQELKKDFRVIAPDLPGFGGSSAHKDFAGSLRDYSYFVEQFCDALDLRGVYMYVNDSSGIIGLHAAARIRERMAGIVVADTVALPIPFLVKFILKFVVNSSVVRYINRKWNLFPWMVATLAPLKMPFARDDRMLMVSKFDTAAKRDRILDIFLAMAVESNFVDETITEVRSRISDLPVLILFGQFDPMRFVGSIQKFKEMFHRHSVTLIPFEEHFPILASGKEVGQEIRKWIQQCQKDQEFQKNQQCQKEAGQLRSP